MVGMAAAYCYKGIPLRFLASSLFDIPMRYLVYMRSSEVLSHIKTPFTAMISFVFCS